MIGNLASTQISAIALKPNLAIAYHNLGLVLLYQGNVSQGRSLVEKALSLDPGLPQAHFLLGLLLARQNRIYEAERELNAARKLFQQQGNQSAIAEVEMAISALKTYLIALIRPKIFVTNTKKLFANI